MKKYIFFISSFLLSSSIFAAPPPPPSMSATVTVNPLHTVAIVGNPVTVTAIHTASVTNNSDFLRNIYVNYIICAGNKPCDITRYKVAVNSHSVWHDGMQTHLTVTYSNPGHYPFTARTTVDGLANIEGTNTVDVN